MYLCAGNRRKFHAVFIGRVGDLVQKHSHLAGVRSDVLDFVLDLWGEIGLNDGV